MPVADAIKAYQNLAHEVFSETKLTGQDGRFKASRLEAAIKNLEHPCTVPHLRQPPRAGRGVHNLGAARATSAAPTFFKRIEIGAGPRVEGFIDGGLGRNSASPTADGSDSLLKRVIPLDVIRAMVAIATDCETTNQEMEKRFRGARGWKRLADVSAHAKHYMKHEAVRQQLGEVVKGLSGRVGVFPTGEPGTQMIDIC
ncbi:hypothetical protein B0H10DRAFT_1967232 [Mycena sp. CBHHK59/15]|nr:hypothetical protein B0H10DRAFT_1967232 [Mycena sp. CBHHK59/15]